jgi:hypothetical protein
VTAYRRFRQARRVVGDVRFIWWALGLIGAALASFFRWIA